VNRRRGDGFCFLRAGIPSTVKRVVFGHAIICICRLV
jgi:hypothetical protein